MTERTRPKLWTHETQRLDEHVDIVAAYPEANFKPFDIVLLRTTLLPMYRGENCFVRFDRLNEPGARKDRLTLTLQDTALLEDTLEHYSLVLQQMEALGVGMHLQAEMRPADKSVERLYGVLDPHWYAVRINWRPSFAAGEGYAEIAKSATLQFVDGCLETGAYFMDKRKEPESLTTSRAALIGIRYNEHSRWQPRRTLLIDGFTKRDRLLSLLTRLVYQQDCIRTTSNEWVDAENCIVYYLAEHVAVFLFEQLQQELLPALKSDGFTGRVELSKPGFEHRRVAGEKRAVQVADRMSLAYLRWQCCSAAVTLSSPALNIPIYVVMFIVKWLPGMYRLRDFECLRLIESVYGSTRRVYSRRDEAEANKQQNKR